jgi:hypothetical protein
MTEPIHNTAAYKTLAETVIDILDDPGMAKHAGFEEKEVQRAQRQMRLSRASKEDSHQGGHCCQPRVRRFSTLPDGVPCSSCPITDFFTERVLHGRLRGDLLPTSWPRRRGGAPAQAWPQTRGCLLLHARARDVQLDQL